MIALEIFCALVTIAAAGGGAALLAAPKRGARGVEVTSLAVIFGGAFVSMALFVFSFVWQGVGLQTAVSACCFGLGLLGVWRARRDRVEMVWEKPAKPHGYWVCGLLTVFLLAVAWQTINQTLLWDGLLSWEIKARLAFLGRGQIPLSYYSDPTRQWTHPPYPLAIPFTECWLYLWIGRADQGLAKLLFLPLPAAGAGLLYCGARKISGEPWRGSVAALLIFFVPSAILGPGTAAAAWADVPLAIVYLAAVIYLLEFALRGSHDALRLFGLCAAILPWIKQEGLILFACLALILVTLAQRRRSLIPAVFALAPGVAVVLGWKLFLLLTRTPPTGDFVPLRFATFAANFGRIEVIAKFLGGQFFDWDRWSVLWIVTLAALCQLARGRRNVEAAILTVCILVPIALYSCVYIFSAWPNYAAHLSTSLPRLMLAPAFAAVLAIALVLPSFPPRK